MTQEQKEKLEHKAKDYIKPFAHQLHLGADEGLIMDLVGFAQTILDNPQEWGLEYSTQTFKDVLAAASQHAMENELLKSQLAKYREALERIANADDKGIEFGPLDIARLMKSCAKEALKKELNND